MVSQIENRKNMRNFLILLAVAAALFIASCVGEYDNINKYSGEVVYPATFDTIIAKIGFERVELDLWKAGRMTASQMKLGKAVRTIVEYDGKQYPIDSICSWVNVTGLTQAKLYRIKVYTEDEFGNYSVPQSVAVIPFTSFDRDLMDFSPPRLTLKPTSFWVEWSSNTLNTVAMDFCRMTWSYKDGANQTKSGVFEKDDSPRFLAENVTPSSVVTIDVTYKVVPRLSDNDGTRILDTLYIDRSIEVQVPGMNSLCSPAERAVFLGNNLGELTYANIANAKALTFPLHTTTFQDLFFCESLETLDLTGAGLQNVLPTTSFAGGGISSLVGGGAWQPFMRLYAKENDINISATSFLSDMLESGQLKKIRYIPGTMRLDEMFAPYVDSGVVELVGYDDPVFPAEVYIEPQFWANGLAQDGNWRMENAYSGDFLPRPTFSDIKKFNAQSEYVNGKLINMHLEQLIQSDGKNIYKSLIQGQSASFFMALPTQYMFDSRNYRYLKFKVFCGTALEDMTGEMKVYSRPWIRFMNNLWAFGGYNNGYGQSDWSPGVAGGLSDGEIQNTWKEYTVDMNDNNWWGGNRDRTDNGDGDRRCKVIVFNLGGEPWNGFDYTESPELAIYVADIRLCKTN